MAAFKLMFGVPLAVTARSPATEPLFAVFVDAQRLASLAPVNSLRIAVGVARELGSTLGHDHIVEVRSGAAGASQPYAQYCAGCERVKYVATFGYCTDMDNTQECEACRERGWDAWNESRYAETPA